MTRSTVGCGVCGKPSGAIDKPSEVMHPAPGVLAVSVDHERGTTPVRRPDGADTADLRGTRTDVGRAPP